MKFLRTCMVTVMVVQMSVSFVEAQEGVEGVMIHKNLLAHSSQEQYNNPFGKMQMNEQIMPSNPLEIWNLRNNNDEVTIKKLVAICKSDRSLHLRVIALSAIATNENSQVPYVLKEIILSTNNKEYQKAAMCFLCLRFDSVTHKVIAELLASDISQDLKTYFQNMVAVAMKFLQNEQQIQVTFKEVLKKILLATNKEDKNTAIEDIVQIINGNAQEEIQISALNALRMLSFIPEVNEKIIEHYLKIAKDHPSQKLRKYVIHDIVLFQKEEVAKRCVTIILTAGYSESIQEYTNEIIYVFELLTTWKDLPRKVKDFTLKKKPIRVLMDFLSIEIERISRGRIQLRNETQSATPNQTYTEQVKQVSATLKSALPDRVKYIFAMQYATLYTVIYPVRLFWVLGAAVIGNQEGTMRAFVHAVTSPFIFILLVFDGIPSVFFNYSFFMSFLEATGWMSYVYEEKIAPQMIQQVQERKTQDR